MRILGIDAGFSGPGLAVVETSPENPIGTVLLAECFAAKIPKDVLAQSKTLQKCWKIRQNSFRIVDVIDQYQPEVIVTEYPTSGAKSAKAAQGMAMAVAMTECSIELYSKLKGVPIEVHRITPISNKKGATGKRVWDTDLEHGKWEIFNAVKAIWPNVDWPHKVTRKVVQGTLDDNLCWGMADALACVVTYLRQNGVVLPIHSDLA